MEAQDKKLRNALNKRAFFNALMFIAKQHRIYKCDLTNSWQLLTGQHIHYSFATDFAL